jgi:hypothetical protein
VDAAHFGRAATGEMADPPGQAGLPHPRLGFFGVIDERFDRDLLGAAAELRPDYQFVMVGPVVKIDPAELPRASNIRYLGQHQYADLPAFLAGWDVALLPFARNDSTKYISPTKTVEYTAAGKPVVSTPITDVAEPYGDMVRLADTRYPFQGSLYGLPADVIKECIVGAIEARFGSLGKQPDPKPPANGNGHRQVLSGYPSQWQNGNGNGHGRNGTCAVRWRRAGSAGGCRCRTSKR